MTTTTPEGRAYADRLMEAFPEEYAAGVAEMDAEDAASLAACPTVGALADNLADPSAEADYGEVLDRMCGDAPLVPGPLGHVGHGALPEALFSAALWEAA